MYEDHDEAQERTLWDRIGIAAVLLLVAAFLLGTMAPLMSSAGADLTGKRDDDSRELVAVEDDDDDDDALGKGSRSGGDTSRSHSANTKTGTTKGTGPSKTVSNSSDRSANTKTGTTRGTGPSRSVSNSS